MTAPRVCVIDQDNVRASMGWPSGYDFRAAVIAWAASQGAAATADLTIISVDERHKRLPGHEQQHCSQLAGDAVLACFSGPRWRADDLIARDVEWWMRRLPGSPVWVVSSDKQVRRRCRDAQRRVGAAADGLVSFEGGEPFGMLLPRTASRPRELQPPPEPPGPPEPESAAEPAVASLPESAPMELDAPIDAPEPAMGPGPRAGEPAPTASVHPLARQIETFISWISLQPRPTTTAFEAAHAGEIQRRGSKRKLGQKR
jgi:hypothetical protein